MIELCGTEEVTFEIGGRIDPGRARELVPPALSLEPIDGGARVSVLFFRMRGLRPRGVPIPGQDYDEALFRIGVAWNGSPAWLAVACHLDRAHVRIVGEHLVRYPVRDGRFTLEAAAGRGRFEVHERGAGRLAFEVEIARGTVPVARPRPVLVRQGGHLYEIPWREDPAPDRRPARVRSVDDALARDVLGWEGIVWDPTGEVLRGRVHRCGLARKLGSTSG